MMLREAFLLPADYTVLQSLRVAVVDDVPALVCAAEQEAVDVVQVTLVKGVQLVVQVLQVGDALARHTFPRREVGSHEVSVEGGEQGEHDGHQQCDAQRQQQQPVGAQPSVPLSLCTQRAAVTQQTVAFLVWSGTAPSHGETPHTQKGVGMVGLMTTWH